MSRLTIVSVVILTAAAPVATAVRPQQASTASAPPAGKRAKALEANLDSFALNLSYNEAKKDLSAGVSLSTAGPPAAAFNDRFASVRIDKARAAAIIDYLDKTGLLGRLLDPQTLAILDMQIPMPHLHVCVTAGKLRFENWLPIDPRAVELVEALGELLDGDAARAMSKLLAALEPYRKMWRQRAALFVKRMKAAKGRLNLILRYDPVGLRDRDAYPNLHLLWLEPAGVSLPSSIIVMSRREATAAIDALDKAGYFERAGNITARRAMRTRTPWPEHRGPCYSLIVSSDNLDCHANLGWDLKMLGCLDALRKAFDRGSDAGKAMDRVLKALEPRRKKWQKGAATQPGKTARDVKVRQVCMAALRKMQKDFAALAAKYPKELGQLGPGTIDEKKLLLRFPVKSLPRAAPGMQPAAGRSRPLPLQPWDCGLFFRFTAPMSPKASAARWLHLNVSFAWRWMWPNRPFSWKAQQDLMKMVSQALVPLNDLENATIAADLAKRGKGSYVLRGRPGVKLTIRLSPRRDAGGTVVDLYATNGTKGVLALCPPFTQIIGDGKPWHYRAPGFLSMLTHAFGRDEDPFIYVEPGQTAKVGAAVAAGLSAGRHTVRVAAGHPCDYWVDMRPTFHDGSPVARKVAGAWTGVLVSGEMTIDIPTPAAANKKAAERAKLLKKNTGMLYLALLYHVGGTGARPSLHLATTVYKIETIGAVLASLTPKEAANIIDHLAKEGFLAQAENVAGKDITPPRGPAYTFTVMGAGQTKLYQVLGWNLKTLHRLDALQKVLDKGSNAAKAMEKVLKALEPQRKKWQREASRVESLKAVGPQGDKRRMGSRTVRH